MTYNKSLDEKYEIIHEIKQGGFGIVYYGIDKKLNKPVAIKEIAPNLLDDPKYLDMFQEEALNIAKLSHNNIVHIYELKKNADNHLFIIMEYIDGIDLEKIIRACKKADKKIPHHLSVYIIAEICMALDYAHQRRDAFTNKPLNLVHQDISPSNIMISRFGGVKLIDFGIASVRRHRKSKKDNKLRGKIPYMAPEQLIMGNQPDHRSDLFSLGLVLYESLTGERLFNSQEEVLTAGKNPKVFKKLLKGQKLPSPLAKILSKALEIDIAKRYQSSNHMYIDLLQYLISCNETGELMDQLAEFLTEFGSRNLPTTQTPSFMEMDSEESTLSPASDAISLDEEWSPASFSTNEGHYSAKLTQPLISTEDTLPPLQTISTIELDAEDEELKTVIDVLRTSARSNKKRIVQYCLGLLLIILIWGVLDTLNGWTQAGIWVYDRLFPPAIEIATIPAQAEIHLDGEPITGKTPLGIDKITPGVHKLELFHEGYKPIVKSLFVPRKGSVKVQGEINTERSYLFRFSTEIFIDSNPPQAQVFINGIRFNQKTPCSFSWEVGNPLALELQREGFQKLTGYSLNTIEGFDEVEDRRFWQLNVLEDSYAKYSIKGIFRKEVTFETTPSAVEIVDATTNEAIGFTSSGSSTIFLSAGTHKIELRKNNFISKHITLKIDEKFDQKVTAVLSRNVRFTAFDSRNPTRDDIGATLVSLRNRNGEYLRTPKQTPLELVLPAYSYQAVFEKDGYQQAETAFNSEAITVQVQMQQAKSTIKFNVIDALSSQPISGVEIYYNLLDNPNPIDYFFAQTDSEGLGLGEVKAGNYTFKIKKSGYISTDRNLLARAGKTHSLTFRLYPSN